MPGPTQTIADLAARVAALEAERAQALRRAETDSLTGLVNRGAFTEALGARLAEAERDGTSVALFVIDLDRFKHLNDTLGHQAGDLLLAVVGRRLAEEAKPGELAARLGGDEFALILMNCSGDDACLLLERLQQALAGSPLSVPGGAVPLRFSAGVAELHAAESLEQVLERADTALLDAKQLGKAMVRLSVPPAQSAQAATANACD